MPSRSSTTPLIRCVAPDRRTKACCAAHAISGCAIRTAYPNGNGLHLRTCPCVTQDCTCLPDPAGLSGPLPTAISRGSNRLPEEMVLLGHPQPARTGHRCGAYRQASLGRYSAMVRQQDRQRVDRGYQQLGASRKGQGARLPFNPKPQGHRLSAGREARSAAAPV